MRCETKYIKNIIRKETFFAKLWKNKYSLIILQKRFQDGKITLYVNINWMRKMQFRVVREENWKNDLSCSWMEENSSPGSSEVGSWIEIRDKSWQRMDALALLVEFFPKFPWSQRNSRSFLDRSLAMLLHSQSLTQLQYL